MEDIKETLVKSIENNLRFVITISIFFLTIFSDSKLAGSIIIVFYIIDYIIFEITVKNLTARNLKWIKTSLFIGIGSYIIPLSIMALSTQGGNIGGFELYTLTSSLVISIYSIVTIPTITLAMMIIFSSEILHKIDREIF